MNQLVTLEPRHKPLAHSDFSKLEELIEDNFDFELITRATKIPKVDDLGIIYGYEHDIITVGMKLVPKEGVEINLNQLMNSLKRPITNMSVGVNLERL